MNINYFPSYISANHLTPPAWEFCGTPCALACLCYSCAFASPPLGVLMGKAFPPETLNSFCTYPHLYPRENIQMTLLLMRSISALKTCTNDTIRNKAWSRGMMLFRENEIKWELQDALCTSSFIVTYKKSYVTKMSEWYISKKFLMEIIATAKSWKQTLD